MAKKKDDEKPQRPIISFEIVPRPLSLRGQYDMDAEAKALLETMESGQAVRLHIDEQVDLHKIHMALRHAMKRSKASLHYRKIGERTLLAWAEKVTKGLVMAVLLTELFTGCAGYTKAMYGDGPAFEDYKYCVYRNVLRSALDACMKERGWVKDAGLQPDGPQAYHRAA